MRVKVLARRFRRDIEECRSTDCEARCAWDWAMTGLAPVYVCVHSVRLDNLGPKTNDRIRAIKAVRDATHCSLLEAKERVEHGSVFMCPHTQANELQARLYDRGHYRCSFVAKVAEGEVL